jgi:hypothetical protein
MPYKSDEQRKAVHANHVRKARGLSVQEFKKLSDDTPLISKDGDILTKYSLYDLIHNDYDMSIDNGLTPKQALKKHEESLPKSVGYYRIYDGMSKKEFIKALDNNENPNFDEKGKWKSFDKPPVIDSSWIKEKKSGSVGNYW